MPGSEQDPPSGEPLRTPVPPAGPGGAHVISLEEARRRLRPAAPGVGPRPEPVDPSRRAERAPGWGPAVRRAMAAADGGALGDALRRACHDALVGTGDAAADEPSPAALDELCALVESLRRSSLWRRAARAERLLLGAPFAVAVPPARPVPGPGGARPGGAAEAQMVEGVIDLAFREPAGWVVATFRPDAFAGAAQRRARTQVLRRRVEVLAAAWQRATGEPVSERALLFTHDGSELAW